MRRYPLQALVAASGLTEEALARAVGMHRKTLQRARGRGFTESAAERYATRAGFHAVNVWPEMADHFFEDESVPCEECGVRFVPTRKGHRFCTSRCYHRNYSRGFQRRKYATDPEYREKKLAKAAAYRAESARVLAAKQRAWNERNSEHRRRYQRAYYQANREVLLAKQAERDARRRSAA